MSEVFALEAQQRDVIGKKVRRLRASGQIPAVIYGPKQEPVHISIEWTQLRKTLLDAGGTHIVEIKVDGTTYPVLIREVDRHPVRRNVQHVDFYAVDVTVRLVTSIPVTMINDKETAERLTGRIILDLTAIDVESLPGNIPESIIVDASMLQEMGDLITVADLSAPEGVSIVTDGTMLVARTAHYSAAVEEETEELEEGLEGDASQPEVIGRGREDEDDD
jgi:large subunit ribosomal protein L25